MSSLTACAHDTTGTAPRAISEYCLIAKPITFSEKHQGDVEDVNNKFDTDDTVKQVRDHDLKFDATCPH
jgi:hypothetical protein